MEFDGLSQRVTGCAIEVHRVLGPGLLESAYERCLAHELAAAKIPFVQQMAVLVDYKGEVLDCGYRADLVVDGKIIVELKCCDGITSVHQAQLLTYMKLAKIGTGLLLNFNAKRLKDGIKRMVLSDVKTRID
jgi:GxxExxY protein